MLLFAFAIGSALFWSGGLVNWTTLGINLVAASLGMIALHFRWRVQERRAFTPTKAKDVFR